MVTLFALVSVGVSTRVYLTRLTSKYYYVKLGHGVLVVVSLLETAVNVFDCLNRIVTKWDVIRRSASRTLECRHRDVFSIIPYLHR